MPHNIHATAIILGDRGILIRGGSGSGKTTLALTLLRDARNAGRFASLVADDQLFASISNGRLIVSAPTSIAGMVEIPYFGIRKIPSEERAVVDLVVRLEKPDALQRLPEGGSEEIAGRVVPMLAVPERAAETAGLAILAHLGIG